MSMTNTFEKRKLSSLALLAKLENEELFSLIEQLLESNKQDDWALQLSEQDKVEIEDGLKDIEEGRTEDYKDFQNRIKTIFK